MLSFVACCPPPESIISTRMYNFSFSALWSVFIKNFFLNYPSDKSHEFGRMVPSPLSTLVSLTGHVTLAPGPDTLDTRVTIIWNLNIGPIRTTEAERRCEMEPLCFQEILLLRCPSARRPGLRLTSRWLGNICLKCCKWSQLWVARS